MSRAHRDERSHLLHTGPMRLVPGQNSESYRVQCKLQLCQIPTKSPWVLPKTSLCLELLTFIKYVLLRYLTVTDMVTFLTFLKKIKHQKCYFCLDKHHYGIFVTTQTAELVGTFSGNRERGFVQSHTSYKENY